MSASRAERGRGGLRFDARSTAAAAALAWATGLATFGLFAPGAAAELAEPTIAGVHRALLWIAAGSSFALFLVVLFGRRARALDPSAAWSAAGAMALAPWVCHGSLFLADEIFGQLALLAFGACLARAAAISLGGLERLTMPPRAGAAVVLVVAAALAVWASREAIDLHVRFETRAFDLATYEQAFWNTLHGRILETSYIDGGTLLGHHFSPGLLLPIAAYAVLPETETLLAFQAACVTFAAVPLYGFVARRTGDSLLAALLALAYLLSPAIELPLFYDYHDVSLLPLAVFSTLWALEAGHGRLVVLGLLATASVKEEGALLAAGILVWSALDGLVSPKTSLFAAAALVGYFLVVKAIVMPAISGRGVVHLHYYDRLVPAGGGGLGDVALGALASPVGALREALTPAKLLHFARLAFPLLLLPFARPPGLVLLAVPIGIVFLSTRSAVHDFVFQYNFYLVPLLVAAAAIALATWRDRRAAVAAAATMLLLAGIENRHHGPVLRQAPTPIRLHAVLRPPTDEERDRHARLVPVLAGIPPSVSVGAAETLGPHLARRERLYRVHRSPGNVDVVVVWTEETDELERARGAAEIRGYEVVHRSEDLTIYARPALEAWRWFARGRPPRESPPA